MSMCAACGTTHPSSWDRSACAAIGGRVRGESFGPHDPEALCVMCGTMAEWSTLLEHMKAHHGHAEVPSDGRLVRFVYETRAVDDYREEVRYPEWTERDPITGETP